MVLAIVLDGPLLRFPCWFQGRQILCASVSNLRARSPCLGANCFGCYRNGRVSEPAARDEQGNKKFGSVAAALCEERSWATGAKAVGVWMSLYISLGIRVGA